MPNLLDKPLVQPLDEKASRGEQRWGFWKGELSRDHHGPDCQADGLGLRSLGKEVEIREEITENFDCLTCNISKYQTGKETPQITVKVKWARENILQAILWWKG